MYINTWFEALIAIIILAAALLILVHDILKKWWFLNESKTFMGYGESTPKLKFWIMFPGAYTRYLSYAVRDWWVRRANIMRRGA